MDQEDNSINSQDQNNKTHLTFLYTTVNIEYSTSQINFNDIPTKEDNKI